MYMCVQRPLDNLAPPQSSGPTILELMLTLRARVAFTHSHRKRQ